MEPVDETNTDLKKKLIDEKQSTNDPFFCANFFQCMTNCCFLLCA